MTRLMSTEVNWSGTKRFHSSPYWHPDICGHLSLPEINHLQLPLGKDSDAGRDWGQEEKRTTEDEMAGWHHRHDGHEFGYIPGVGDGQGGLACCDSWGHRVGHG